MRLRDLIIQSIKQRKLRTILCIIGMILSTMTVMVISLSADKYLASTSGFFIPFEDYNQIVERGTNYFQYLPAGSFMNESYKEEIESHFSTEAYPTLIMSNDKNVSSIEYNYFIGLELESIPKIWEKVGLSSGNWPLNSAQVIVGHDIEINNSNVLINNKEYPVSGILTTSNSFLDGMIIIDLHLLQNIYNLSQIVSIFFISKEIEVTPSNIESFEEEYPNLDLVTKAEEDEIKGGIKKFTEDISSLFNMFAIISSLIFVFTIEFINIMNRKKDIAILQLIGTPRSIIFKSIWGETIFFIVSGLIIGIPFSFVTFISVFAFILTRIGNSDTFLLAAKELTINIIHISQFNMMIKNTLIILLGGLIMAIFPAYIALKIKPLEKANDRI